MVLLLAGVGFLVLRWFVRYVSRISDPNDVLFPTDFQGRHFNTFGRKIGVDIENKQIVIGKRKSNAIYIPYSDLRSWRSKHSWVILNGRQINGFWVTITTSDVNNPVHEVQCKSMAQADEIVAVISAAVNG